MGNESFYLNNKLVSVHLSYKEKNNNYIWTDTIYKIGFFGSKKRKLKEFYWFEKQLLNYVLTFSDLDKYSTDEELLKNINPIGVHKYSINNKQVYYNPKVTFKYVNGEIIIKYFNKNSEAEKYYNEIKSKYNNNEYIIYE